LTLYECRLPGVPNEVLSQEPHDNCLDRLRNFLAAASAGTTSIVDVKLLVLGNGRAGKTQLVRRLNGAPFDSTSPSTHGVQIQQIILPALGDWPERRLHVWDFGGQDIYHGTHALFARASAVFLVVWSDDTNDNLNIVVDGVRFRNHPLPYWVDYVGHARRAGSCLVVRSKCDLPLAGAITERLPADGTWVPLRFSAATGLGLSALKSAIQAAVAHLNEETGEKVIPLSWHLVQTKIESLRDQGVREIDDQTFASLCPEEAGPAHFVLSYLHNAGIVFHGEGVFDKIVLDQKWAIDGIYAVLERDRSVRMVRNANGRFRRQTLDDVIWHTLGYSPEEQRVFLGMMEKCGICFAYRRHHGTEIDETVYIAPDLLPPRAEVEPFLTGLWGTDEGDQQAVFRFPFLHHGLIRALIAWIGDQAGPDAIYWRGGVYATEINTRSKLLIEEDPDASTIVIATKGGDARILLEQIVQQVQRRSEWHGLTPELNRPLRKETMAELTPPPDPNFAQPNRDARQFGVSYAWEDKDNPDRAKIVDDLCARAISKGIRIARDKDVLQPGDDLKGFMDRLAGSNRLFVIITDKYLKSTNCMRELSWLWRRCRQIGQTEDFMSRVRIYKDKDTKLSNELDVARVVAWWSDHLTELNALTEKIRAVTHGTELERSIREIEDFTRDLPNILPLVFRYMRHDTLDDLDKYGLDGAP
jgi:internalin A